MKWARLLLVALAGCQSPLPPPPPGSAWIAWDPADPALVERVEQIVAEWNADGEWITTSEMIELDPLYVVPDDRFRAAFPELKPTDSRVSHCQMGPTLSNIATIAFTPEPVSETEVREKGLRCELDAEHRASLCEFVTGTAYRLPGSDQVFRIDEDVDRSEAMAVMSLLARGSFRSEVPDFPPPGWQQDWSSQHAGRYLGPALDEYEGPHRYALWFPGCGCQQILVLEHGSARAQSEVIIVGQSGICV